MRQRKSISSESRQSASSGQSLSSRNSVTPGRDKMKRKEELIDSP